MVTRIKETILKATSNSHGINDLNNIRLDPVKFPDPLNQRDVVVTAKGGKRYFTLGPLCTLVTSAVAVPATTPRFEPPITWQQSGTTLWVESIQLKAEVWRAGGADPFWDGIGVKFQLNDVDMLPLQNPNAIIFPTGATSQAYAVPQPQWIELMKTPYPIKTADRLRMGWFVDNPGIRYYVFVRIEGYWEPDTK